MPYYFLFAFTSCARRFSGIVHSVRAHSIGVAEDAQRGGTRRGGAWRWGAWHGGAWHGGAWHEGACMKLHHVGVQCMAQGVCGQCCGSSPVLDRIRSDLSAETGSDPDPTY